MYPSTYLHTYIYISCFYNTASVPDTLTLICIVPQVHALLDRLRSQYQEQHRLHHDDMHRKKLIRKVRYVYRGLYMVHRNIDVCIMYV
jgi:hypothetical protein